MLKSSLAAVSTTLAILAAIVSLFLAVHLIIGDPPTVKQPVELTTSQVLDAGVVSDTGPEKVRPTPLQLANTYFIWELRDIEAQATTPEDKQLVHQAIEIRLQWAKDLAPSNDFEKNMQKAVK